MQPIKIEVKDYSSIPNMSWSRLRSWGERCEHSLHETTNREHELTKRIQFRGGGRNRSVCSAIRTVGVEEEVAGGGRVDDHDDLVEVATGDGEKRVLLLLLLRRLLLLLVGWRGRYFTAAAGGAIQPPRRRGRSPSREEGDSGGGAALGLGFAAAVAVEEARRGEG